MVSSLDRWDGPAIRTSAPDRQAAVNAIAVGTDADRWDTVSAPAIRPEAWKVSISFLPFARMVG
jgi:hypothetical protein